MKLAIIFLIFASPLLAFWLIGARKFRRESPPVALTPAQRRKKWINIALSVCFSLGLLAWPMAVGGTVFLFLGPPDGPGVLLALLFALSIWCYPLLWAAGLFFGIRSVKRDEATWIVVLKSSIPLLSGVWVVAFLIVISSLQDLSKFAPLRPNPPPAVERMAE